MRRVLSGMLLVSTLLVTTASLGQNPVYEAGPVWRMVYYRFKPGQDAVFWSEIYPQLKATTVEAEKQGEIIDARFFANPLKAQPDDWDILLMLKYPNYAALDGLGPKSDAVYKKLYPSSEQAEKSFKQRADALEVLSVRLLREIPLK